MSPLAAPTLRDGVRVSGPRYRGSRTVFLLHDADGGRCFEIGAREAFLANRLTSPTTFESVRDDYSAQFDRPLPLAGWGQFLGLLHARRLLAPHAPAPTAPASPVRPSDLRTGRWVVAPLSQVVPRVHRLTRAVFSPWVQAPVAALLVGLLCWLLVQGVTTPDVLAPLHDWRVALGVALLSWVSLSLHELGHGVTAHHLGGRASEVGVLFRPPAVFLYCRVDSTGYSTSRRRQVLVALAGVWVNLVVLLPLWAWWAVDDDPARRQVLLLGMTVGACVGLVNLVPVPPADGFTALAAALGHLDLEHDTGECVRSTVRSLVGRDASPYPARLRAVYLGVAVVRALILAAAATAAVWFCLSVLPTGPAVLTLAGLLALVVTVGVTRLNRRGDAPDLRALPSTPDRPCTTSDPRHPTPSQEGTDMTAAPEARPRPDDLADPDGSATAVRVEGVQKRYGDVTALAGLTLSIRRGEFFGIIGPNGAGKTTLMEIIEGLRRADAGTVSVLGHSPWPRNLALLPHLGVQTQASSFFPSLTALEHLTTVAALYGLGADRAETTLRRFGLWEKHSVAVEKLSGGQQRRLAIAAAVVHDPDVIFLDEPTAALDPQARRELWALLDELRAGGHTILYTTHHLDEAERLCDRVAVVDDGRIVALGTPRDLVRQHASPHVQLVVDSALLTADDAARMDGVVGSRDEGPTTLVETDRPDEILPALGRRVGFENVRTRTMSLEDVYLRLTGKEYSA